MFYLIDSSAARPPSCKHLELKFLEEVTEDILERGDVSLLLGIYAFVFDVVLKITHELNSIQLCKIYSHDYMTKMVYRKFADKLGDDYTVKSYGNWIEIKKSTN